MQIMRTPNGQPLFFSLKLAEYPFCGIQLYRLRIINRGAAAYRFFALNIVPCRYR